MNEDERANNLARIRDSKRSNMSVASEAREGLEISTESQTVFRNLYSFCKKRIRTIGSFPN